MTCAPVMPIAAASASRSARVGVGVTSNASDSACVTRALNLPVGVARMLGSTDNGAGAGEG